MTVRVLSIVAIIGSKLMSKQQRILASALWAFLVLGMMGVIGASLWTGKVTAENLLEQDAGVIPGELPVLFPAPGFSLINQDHEPVTEQSFRGQPWVAAFIFTQCAGPCPMMSAKMATLQERIPDASIKLVSISVDPERDTPDVLKQYASKLKADTTRWFFLTGDRPAILQLSAGLKLTMPDAPDPLLHSTRFVLIDDKGDVRGTYDGTSEESVAKLVNDAALAGPSHGSVAMIPPKETLALINATLNGTSAVLLVTAFILVRRKNYVGHASCMIAALTTSTLFLVSYITSIVVYHDRSSGLQPGLLRTGYFILLFTHVVLAIGMLPLIGLAVLRAYQRQWVKHRRVAFPAFVIWLYVSVTGVIIYWMLYHYFPSLQA